MTLDNICKILEKDNIFLTGGAGVGKSYTTMKIIEKFKKDGKNVISLGSTGVSAVAINGMTVHSFFIFGIANSLEELDIGDKKSKHRLVELKKIISSTDLIVIDEISMISASLIDMIAYRLDSMGFLGKIMFVGDFFQLSPIVKYKENVGLFDSLLFAFESSSWQNFAPVVIELTKMHRTHDAGFTKILSKIRKGEVDSKVIEYIKSLEQNKALENSTYLFGKNEHVEKMNREKLAELSSPAVMLIAQNSSIKKVHENKILNWQKSLPVPDTLTLKVGAPVLFCVNKWGKYANGERGIIKEITNEAVIVEKDDSFVRVEPHVFELGEFHANEDGKLKSVTLATMSQFPLKLAYAITIHKSQGMSIDNLVCNVDNIFTPSQFYVALSRATDPKTLKVDYNGSNLEYYLKKVISIDPRVVEFYESTI
ncbi:MAG: DEAD/DEAH box helicase [Sulfurovaceae bacterium]|nr:DEAD/DEAH box helicase [Sulfurovaceae bacterium]